MQVKQKSSSRWLFFWLFCGTIILASAILVYGYWAFGIGELRYGSIAVSSLILVTLILAHGGSGIREILAKVWVVIFFAAVFVFCVGFLFTGILDADVAMSSLGFLVWGYPMIGFLRGLG